MNIVVEGVEQLLTKENTRCNKIMCQNSSLWGAQDFVTVILANQILHTHALPIYIYLLFIMHLSNIFLTSSLIFSIHSQCQKQHDFFFVDLAITRVVKTSITCACKNFNEWSNTG